MEPHPKRRILVLSERDPSQLPIFQALQDLGYSMEQSSEIPVSTDETPFGIVLVSIGSVLEGTGADELGLSLGLSIGIYSRHPRESKTLEEILEEVDQRMYADKRAKNEDQADDYRR